LRDPEMMTMMMMMAMMMMIEGSSTSFARQQSRLRSHTWKI
jgi:hypothetical protein